MRISAKALINYFNVNSFSQANQWTIRAAEPNTLYFQLVDLDQDSLRYMAGIGASNQPYSVQVTFPSIDDNAVITLTATQADSADSSLWKISIPSSQTPASGTVVFSLTEGSVIRSFSVLNLISVEYPGNDGSC